MKKTILKNPLFSAFFFSFILCVFMLFSGSKISAYQDKYVIYDTTVVYEDGAEGYIMTEAGMRFGACITKELYDALGKDDVLWGVEYCLSQTPNWTSSGVKQVICEPARVAYSGSNIVDENGEFYQFALVITNLQYEHIDTYVSARVFVFDGENIYYMQSTTYSLRTLASAYLNLNDTSSFEEHLDILRHIKNYK